RRTSVILFFFLALVSGGPVAFAFTTVQFISLQSQINNEIATLSALEDPTREQRNLLRSFNRATNVLAKTSASDGKTLRGVNSILGRIPACVPALTGVASNLLLTFNSEYAFVGTLLLELPPSHEA